MMRFSRKFYLSLFVLAELSVCACKYNVRDVGFVYLEPVPYRLFGFVHSDSADELITTLQNTAAASFLDSNVECRIIDPKKSPADDALKYRRGMGAGDRPELVLVSPEGRFISIPCEGAKESVQSAVWSAVESVASSPLRDKILKAITQVYAVVLLVEGTDAEENKLAREAADHAVRELAIVMERFPKPVRLPPQVMVVSQSQFAREKVLLWSLGIGERQPKKPAVAVLYGRGRRIGPVLEGDKISSQQIASILGVLGQDCECDLDRAWMQGPLIPARWDSNLQAEVLKEVGFDAENPMVKTEISRILARGPSSGARRVSLPGIDGVGLLGYKETSIGKEAAPREPEFGAESNSQDVVVESVVENNSVEPEPLDTVENETTAKQRFPLLGIVVLGFSVATLGGGLLVWLRSRPI